MMQPIVPRHVYYWVYGALLALTLLTVGVAFLDLGPLNLILALGIAICKALLVMLFEPGSATSPRAPRSPSS